MNTEAQLEDRELSYIHGFATRVLTRDTQYVIAAGTVAQVRNLVAEIAPDIAIYDDRILPVLILPHDKLITTKRQEVEV
jgi:hypothetical protein